jgi:ribosomal-protein-alanine N-acetyltransferase
MIEAATWRDLNAVRHLEKVCFPQDAWPLLDVIGILTLPGVIRLKACLDGQVVGFVAGDVRKGEAIAWIATIGVLPEYRSQGIGSALLTACEQRLEVPTVRLCVRTSNRDAIRLYQHHRYQDIGKWERYYADGEDATVMEKKLVE